MKRLILLGCGVLFVVVVMVAALFPRRGHAEETKKPCCFSNPRYTGICKVVPAEGSTCSSILAYLNKNNSVGKTYCGNTRIRGGWTSVQCPEE